MSWLALRMGSVATVTDVLQGFRQVARSAAVPARVQTAPAPDGISLSHLPSDAEMGTKDPGPTDGPMPGPTSAGGVAARIRVPSDRSPVRPAGGPPVRPAATPTGAAGRASGAALRSLRPAPSRARRPG